MKERVVLTCLAACLFCSCAIVDHSVEAGKTVWGSSTRALEAARDRAVTRTFEKPYWDCVRSAIAVAAQNKWVVFKKDEIKGYLVVMGIPGSVNTTEVGIFLVEVSDTRTRIEVSSLSTNAKRNVSHALFHGMDIAFGDLPPDKPAEALKTSS